MEAPLKERRRPTLTLRYLDEPLTVGRKLILLGVLLVGLLVRGVGLGEKPRVEDLADEVHFIWMGQSLIETGHPQSWSLFKVYDRHNATKAEGFFHGLQFYIVNPCMDHPPLFGVIAGAYAKLVGATEKRVTLTNSIPAGFEVREVDLWKARTLSLILYAALFFSLFELGRRDIGYAPTVLGLLFHAVLASAVLHGRLIATENLTTPLLLFNLIMLQRRVAGKSSGAALAAVSVMCSGVVVLCKVAAIASAGTIAALTFATGRRREAIWAVVGAAAGLGLLFLYGYWQNWAIFSEVLASQARRYSGVNPWYQVVADQRIGWQPAYSQLLFAGWVALLGLGLSTRRGPGAGLVLVTPLLLFLQLCFFMTLRELYGWHLIPFIPFCMLALGWIICEAPRQTARGNIAPFLVLLALLAPGAGQFLFDSYPGTSVVRYVYLGFCLAGSGVFLLRNPESRAKAGGLLLVVMILLLAARELELLRLY